MSTQNKNFNLFKIRFIFCLLVLLLISTSLMAKVIVEGRAIIPDGRSSEGIKVFFFNSTSKILIDSIVTNIKGHYKLTLEDGIYNILFRKGKFYNELNNVELYPYPLSKKIKIDNVRLDKVMYEEINIKNFIFNSRKIDVFDYPYEIELLKSIGRDLKSFSTLTYIGFGISIIGTTIAFSSDKGGKKIGIGISVIGGIISLTAPAKVGSAGKKLEEFAKYKYLEQQKNKTDKNKVKD